MGWVGVLLPVEDGPCVGVTVPLGVDVAVTVGVDGRGDEPLLVVGAVVGFLVGSGVGVLVGSVEGSSVGSGAATTVTVSFPVNFLAASRNA